MNVLQIDFETMMCVFHVICQG